MVKGITAIGVGEVGVWVLCEGRGGLSRRGWRSGRGSSRSWVCGATSPTSSGIVANGQDSSQSYPFLNIQHHACTKEKALWVRHAIEVKAISISMSSQNKPNEV